MVDNLDKRVRQSLPPPSLRVIASSCALVLLLAMAGCAGPSAGSNSEGDSDGPAAEPAAEPPVVLTASLALALGTQTASETLYFAANSTIVISARLNVTGAGPYLAAHPTSSTRGPYATLTWGQFGQRPTGPPTTAPNPIEEFQFKPANGNAAGAMILEELANRTVSSGLESQATLTLNGYGQNTQADFVFTVTPTKTA